ncbi:response regulator transcription factor [Burkholderia pyrrocinia]|uniref:response regulator transcription factor n=1 Tax=Burkholderia pyrrocinia TaxID=60550 RepID=UPI00158EBEB1|nr:response regulator transcription factor [Burkholderia pyrrocinia]
MRIAVLDDDPSQLQFVAEALTPSGHNCYVFTEGRALVHRLQRETFDLVTLDWNVVDMPGDAVLAWIRQNCDVNLPVLFMTSRSREADIIFALNAGADDYVIKPVAGSVLAARVATLLRRTYRHEAPTTSQQFGEYLFDLQKAKLYRNHQLVAVTQKEFQLALLLFRNFARPLSRTHILETVWKHSRDIPTRTLDTHISAVRIKLDLRPQNGYCITPIYGYGYRFEKLDTTHQGLIS